MVNAISPDAGMPGQRGVTVFDPLLTQAKTEWEAMRDDHDRDIRNAALEEAATITETITTRDMDEHTTKIVTLALRAAATAIRKLKR